ncbi:MAG: methyltransferase [Rhizobacter sp.]|nr:methyltransferase [Ferruginibacter sp.]
MSNSFFQLKQFTVHQDQCAMKVCTDACLFGAWVADKIKGNESIKNVLDIGTGTGLLSLMLAQKHDATITAVEMNSNAAKQATDNFNNTPWNVRLNVVQSNILDFESDKKYDCIISNPPFFEADLKSDNQSKNAAKHDTTLTLGELMLQIKRLLKEDGVGCVLIPFHRTSYLEDLIKDNGFFINDKMLVKQSVDHGYFRTMIIFSGKPAAIISEELYIHDDQRQYSEGFITLLKDYYLKL